MPPLQPAGGGPYPGMTGWYVAKVHEACAGPHLEDLARGVVIYRDEAYWRTQPGENGTGCRIDGKP